MTNRYTYECYVCRRNGFENVRVYLDRKTEDGKTIFKNLDMSAHIHKQGQHPAQQQQQPQQVQDSSNSSNPLAPAFDESVERGISSFNPMTSLIKEVEEVKAEIKHLREVLANQERLFNEMLVWTQQINKQLRLQQT